MTAWLSPPGRVGAEHGGAALGVAAHKTTEHAGQSDTPLPATLARGLRPIRRPCRGQDQRGGRRALGGAQGRAGRVHLPLWRAGPLVRLVQGDGGRVQRGRPQPQAAVRKGHEPRSFLRLLRLRGAAAGSTAARRACAVRTRRDGQHRAAGRLRGRVARRAGRAAPARRRPTVQPARSSSHRGRAVCGQAANAGP